MTTGKVGDFLNQLPSVTQKWVFNYNFIECHNFGNPLPSTCMTSFMIIFPLQYDKINGKFVQLKM